MKDTIHAYVVVIEDKPLSVHNTMAAARREETALRRAGWEDAMVYIGDLVPWTHK